MKKRILSLALVLFVMMTAVSVASAEAPAELTYWCAFENNAAKSVSSYSELPIYQEYMSRLNTNLTFIHPPTGMEAEQFALLVASTTLPDIIEYDWYSKYPDGPQAALDEGVIISLNEYIENGTCPNLAAMFAADEDLAASCRTFEGEYYCFPFIRANNLMEQKGGGLTIRKDVLDKLGLDYPQTIADWEAVFEGAQGLGYKHPFIARYDDLHINESTFCGAWGVASGLYVEDGVVKYGPMEPGYKDYLVKMAEWYAKGYIDPDFLTLDNSGLDGKVTSDSVIACFRSPDSGIGVWTKNMQAVDPTIVFAACEFPTLNAEDTRYYSNPNYRFQGSYSAAISTSCKNVEAALKFLDYAYSKEGNLLLNFGVEGTSFVYDANGTPQFTELITNNPDGLTLKEAMIRWCRNSAGGPFEKDAGPILAQRVNNKYQYDAPYIWYNSVDWSRNLPRMVYSGEENETYNGIMTEVDTIVEELTVKVIIGEKDISVYDSYMDAIHTAGVDEALQIVQTAYDRQTGK